MNSTLELVLGFKYVLRGVCKHLSIALDFKSTTI